MSDRAAALSAALYHVHVRCPHAQQCHLARRTIHLGRCTRRCEDQVRAERRGESRKPASNRNASILLIYTNFYRPGTWTSTASLPTASMRRRWTPCSHRGSTRCRTWLRTSMVRTISRSLLSHDSSRRRSLAHPSTRPLALSGASSLTPALAASSSAPPPPSVRVPQYPGGPAASKGGASRGDPSNTKQMTEQQVRLLPFGRLLLLVQ